MSITLGEKLLIKNNVPDEWMEILKPLVNEQEFFEVLLRLSDDSKVTGGIQPNITQIFSVFQYIKPEDVKVIIIGQDPYPQQGVSTGIAFANKNTIQTLSPSLSIILDELTESIPDFNEFIFFENSDLIHWLQQGVLLLNSSFSVKTNTPGSHSKVWKPFVEKLLIKLDRPDLVVVMLGNQAGNFSHCFTKTKTKMKFPHPASDTYSNKRNFRGTGVFNKINQKLDTPINWQGNLNKTKS